MHRFVLCQVEIKEDIQFCIDKFFDTYIDCDVSTLGSFEISTGDIFLRLFSRIDNVTIQW